MYKKKQKTRKPKKLKKNTRETRNKENQITKGTMKKTRQPKHKNQPKDNLINQNKKTREKIKKNIP